MNEQEWLVCTDPTMMLEFLRGKASERQLILFSLACWTTQDYYSEPDWAETITELSDAVLAGKLPLVRLICLFGAFNSASPPTAERWAEMVTQKQPNPTPTQAVQTAFLCDIFGNPFRPVVVAPSWLTSDVLAMATGIYNEKAFDRMPILADTLEDAGCDNTDILDHCRGPGPHVRGCWVVDLVLGKK